MRASATCPHHAPGVERGGRGEVGEGRGKESEGQGGGGRNGDE